MQFPLPDKRTFDWFRVLRKRWRGETAAPPWCRHCGYSVQSLEKNQCPECGSDFRVVGILDPRLAQLPLSRWFFYIYVASAMLLSILVFSEVDRMIYYHSLPGRYVDWINLRFWTNRTSQVHRHQTTEVHLSIRGRAPAQWRRSIMPRQNIRMVEVEIEKQDPGDVQNQRKVYVVDLLERTYQCENDAGPLTQEVMQSWFDGFANEPLIAADSITMKEINEIINSIADGTLPYAGHHGNFRQIRSQDDREIVNISYFNMSHSTSQAIYRIGYWVLALLILYPVGRRIRRISV